MARCHLRGLRQIDPLSGFSRPRTATSKDRFQRLAKLARHPRPFLQRFQCGSVRRDGEHPAAARAFAFLRSGKVFGHHFANLQQRIVREGEINIEVVRAFAAMPKTASCLCANLRLCILEQFDETVATIHAIKWDFVCRIESRAPAEADHVRSARVPFNAANTIKRDQPSELRLSLTGINRTPHLRNRLASIHRAAELEHPVDPRLRAFRGPLREFLCAGFCDRITLRWFYGFGIVGLGVENGSERGLLAEVQLGEVRERAVAARCLCDLRAVEG